MTLPQLDLQNFDLPALDEACRTWGSFVLHGHDIDAKLQREVMAQCRTFFHQPLAEKNQIRRSATNAWGFYDAELTKNRRDWKEIIDIGPPVAHGPLQGSTPQWPALTGFRETMEQLPGAVTPGAGQRRSRAHQPALLSEPGLRLRLCTVSRRPAGPQPGALPPHQLG